jgi:hypothetical protein
VKKKIALAIGAVLIAGIALAGCTESKVASQNLSNDAENFKIERDIVLYNTITDKYIAEVVGRCSVDAADDGLPSGTLAVTCKIGNDKYIKDYFGKADNAIWFELQSKPVKEDVYHYKVTFRPEAVIPNLQVDTSGAPLTAPGDGSVDSFSQHKADNGTSPAPTPSSSVPVPVK